ncbi:MAG TPA: YfhO family protein, partial [Longimicrobiales bacterium]
VTLAVFGFERYLDWARTSDGGDRRAARLYLWGAAGVLVLLALLAQSGALTSVWQSVIYSGMTPDRVQALEADMPVLQAGFWIAAFLAVLLAGVWEAIAAGLAGWRAVLAAVALLAALDLYRVDRPFIRATELVDASPDYATIFAPNDVVAFLQRRQQAGEVFRALDLAPMLQGGGGGNNLNWLAQYGIEQLGGHHPNELGRYRDLIGGEMPANLQLSNFRLLDLTNTAYVVTPQPLQGFPYPVAYQGASGVVYRNPNVLPRAFLVGRTEVVPDSGAIQRLLNGPFDIAHVAALPAALPASVVVQADPRGTVSWSARDANESVLSVSTDRPALLVVTDNYFDAWHAQVDGREVPILRADYTFRAVPVPAGKHSVRMYYHSAVLSASVTTSALLLALLAAIALVGTLLGRRGAVAADAVAAEGASA